MATHVGDWVKQRHQDLAVLALSVDTNRQVSLQSSLLVGTHIFFVHAQPLGFFLCPFLLLPPSFHRSWSLINTFHPDSHSGSAPGNLTQDSFPFYLIIFHLTCLSFPLSLKQWRDSNHQLICKEFFKCIRLSHVTFFYIFISSTNTGGWNRPPTGRRPTLLWWASGTWLKGIRDIL